MLLEWDSPEPQAFVWSRRLDFSGLTARGPFSPDLSPFQSKLGPEPSSALFRGLADFCPCPYSLEHRCREDYADLPGTGAPVVEILEPDGSTVSFPDRIWDWFHLDPRHLAPLLQRPLAPLKGPCLVSLQLTAGLVQTCWVPSVHQSTLICWVAMGTAIPPGDFRASWISKACQDCAIETSIKYQLVTRPRRLIPLPGGSGSAYYLSAPSLGRQSVKSSVWLQIIVALIVVTQSLKAPDIPAGDSNDCLHHWRSVCGRQLHCPGPQPSATCGCWPLKGCSELRCAILSVECTTDFEDLVWKKNEKYLFFIFKCWNVTILDLFWVNWTMLLKWIRPVSYFLF